MSEFYRPKLGVVDQQFNSFFCSRNIIDTSRAYLFVVSRTGEIVFRTDGSINDDSVRLATDSIETAIAKPVRKAHASPVVAQ
jgi:hypothetical protein